jgi:TonB family protein
MLFASARAQPNPAVVYMVAPKPTHISLPTYPEVEKRRIVSAWLELSLTVSKDGRVRNAKIVDGYYRPDFERSTLEAVRRWTFKPGTANGVPVDWTNLTFRVVFDIRNEINVRISGAFPKFKREYKEVNELLKNKRYAEAKQKVQAMIANHDVRLLYEYGAAEMLLATAELNLGHPETALVAIRRATPFPNMRVAELLRPHKVRALSKQEMQTSNFLTGKALEQALHDRFYIDVKLDRYLDALETADHMQQVGKDVLDDTTKEAANGIRQLLTSDAEIRVHAVPESVPWSYRLVRHDFTITDVKGTVNGMDLVCERQSAHLTFQPGSEWLLPPGWGDCTLTVNVGTGTQFTLVEFAKPATAAAEHAKDSAKGFNSIDADKPIWLTPATH